MPSRIYVPIKDASRLFRGGDEVLHLRGTDGVVERVSRWNGPDENEHDESHALLSIVGAMEEADAGAGKNHEHANRKRRWPIVFWSLIKLWELDEAFGDQDEETREGKPDERRDEQRLENFHGLFPIDARSAGMRV